MGSKSPPPAPPQPNPSLVAAAQTGSNVNTAVANSYLGNANQYGPYGSTTFSVNNYESIPDGNGGSVNVPRFNQFTNLSPAEQQKLDQQNKIGSMLNQVAIDQTGRIGKLLGTPIKASDFDRQRVEDALYARLNPQLQRDKASLENTLTNQGFTRGSEAFNQAMDEWSRQSNDARLAVTQQGGSEAARNLQMQLSLRNQPINEVTALMAGGQVSLPQFAGYQGGTVAPTAVGDYYMQNANRLSSQYNAGLGYTSAQQAGLYGGIGSLLGAGLYGLGRR